MPASTSSTPRRCPAPPRRDPDPLNPIEDDATRRILPLASDLGLAVLVNRPFGQGGLLRRPFPGELADARFRSWPDALLRWALSDDRVTVVLTATAAVRHAVANADSGAAPALSPEHRELVYRATRSS
jgi:diketogulonate reductase-like aldo/keto reductase